MYTGVFVFNYRLKVFYYQEKHAMMFASRLLRRKKMFWFDKKIDTNLLRLAQIAYGGEFYYGLNNYRQKELSLEGTKFQKVHDNLLKKIGNTKFFSYKNEDSGFCANLFENIKNGNIVVA